MKKKLTAIALVVCMLAVMLVGASLAYFTDKDEVKNEFTIGNIDIDLWENGSITDKDGNVVQEVVEQEQKGIKYEGLMPTYRIQKEPYITNTGKNDAYVRVAVVMNNLAAINNAIDGTYEGKEGYDAAAIQAVYDEVFECWGVNYSKRAEFPSGSRMWMDSRVGEDSPVLCNIDTIARINDNYYRIDCANAFMTEEEKATENGDGIFDVNWDDLSVSYYVNAAKTGERVYVFYLKLEPNQGYKLFNGLNVPADFTAEQMKMFDGLKIDIYADAIQTVGFDNYVDAFNALEAEHPLGYWN